MKRHEKILQECQDEVAKIHDYSNWLKMFQIISFEYLFGIFRSQVMPLYAKRIAIEWITYYLKHINERYTYEQLYDNFLNEEI